MKAYKRTKIMINIEEVQLMVKKFISYRKAKNIDEVMSRIEERAALRNTYTPYAEKEEFNAIFGCIQVEINKGDHIEVQTLTGMGFDFERYSPRRLFVSKESTDKENLRLALAELGRGMYDKEYRKLTTVKLEAEFEQLKEEHAEKVRVEDMERRALNISSNIKKADKELVVAGQKYIVYGDSETAFDFITRMDDEPDRYSSKKEQITVRQSSLKDLVFDGSVNAFALTEDKIESFPTSEGKLLRYDNIEVEDGYDEETCEPIVKKFADKLMIMDCDVEVMDPYLIPMIVKDGFVFEGKVWKPLLRSASQARTYKMFFTTMDAAKVRHDLSGGAVFGKDGMVNPSKKDAKHGLPNSSSLYGGIHYTHVVIDDHTTVNEYDICTWDGKKDSPLVTGKKELSLVLTDGQGTMSPVAAAKIGYQAGKLSKFELMFFLSHFVSLDHMHTLVYPSKALTKNEQRLVKIFAKVPRTVQGRRVGMKGLLVMFDHAKYGYDVDFCFGDNMIKYYPQTTTNLELEILSVGKEPTGKTFTFYQQLLALDIGKDAVLELAERALEKVFGEGGILKNPIAAKKFLGMLGSMNEESKFVDSLVSKLTHSLNAADEALEATYIQTSLLRLAEKFIKDMSIGRIPISGNYAYVVTDPVVMFDPSNPLLKSGENFYNRTEKEWLGTRSPLIYRSEVAVHKTVDIPEYWFLKNVFIFNSFDDSLPRAGGADTDGDKYQFTDEPLLVEAARHSLPMLYNSGGSGEMVADTDEALENYWINDIAPKEGSTVSIGSITNSATVFSDYGKHLHDIASTDDKVRKLYFLQGRLIDSKKTGELVTVPSDLMPQYIPLWMCYLKTDIKGQEVSDRLHKYESQSPVGHLFRYVQERLKGLYDLKKTPIKNFYNFSKSMDHTLSARIFPTIIQYEGDYRKELSSLGNKVKNGLMGEKEAEATRNAIFDKYVYLMDQLEGDDMTKAALAYGYVHTSRESKSISFPWVATFKGLLELLQANFQSKRMYRLPKKLEEEMLFSYVDIYGGELIHDNKSYGPVPHDIPDGLYFIEQFDGVPYIEVIVENTLDYNIVYRKMNNMVEKYEGVGRTTQFSATGFKRTGQTGQTFLDAVAANGDVFDIINIGERNALYVNGVRYGAVSNMVSKDRPIILDPAFTNARVSLIDHGDVTYETQTEGIKHSNYFAVHVELVENLSDEEIKAYGNAPAVASESTPVTVEGSDHYVSTGGSFTIAPVAQKVEVIDQAVLAHVKLDAPYWDVQDLTPPSAIKDYSFEVINTQTTADAYTTMSFLNVTSFSDTVYQFKIVYAKGKGLQLLTNSNANFSPEFQKWALRLTSYKVREASLRMQG